MLTSNKLKVGRRHAEGWGVFNIQVVWTGGKQLMDKEIPMQGTRKQRADIKVYHLKKTEQFLTAMQTA